MSGTQRPKPHNPESIVIVTLSNLLFLALASFSNSRVIMVPQYAMLFSDLVFPRLQIEIVYLQMLIAIVFQVFNG